MLSRFRLVGACILCAALFVTSLLFLSSPDHTTVQGRMANETSFTLDARFGAGQVRERVVKEGRDVKRPSRRAAAALRRSERQQKAALKRFERKLASPAWKREREKSRIAFRDLAPTKALAAVTDQHEQLIARPTATDLSLREAEKLVAYESPTEARVELDGGKLALVESVNVPLATPADGPGGNGPLVPVQLGLLDRGASWSPKRPAVNTTLPKQASVNATLGDELALALPNKRGAGTLVEEAKVFYANQLPDTDVVLEPRNAGLEISWVLRSPDSPSLLPLDLKGRRGQALKFRLDGAGKVSALSGDRKVAQISPVFVWDAQGRSVEGEYVVGPDGGLSVSVDHAEQDLAYPIVVDPLVRESWSEIDTPAMREDGGGGRAGWVFSDYAGQANVFFKSWDYEPWLGISMAAGNPGGYARWTFGPVRESAIFRVKFLNFRRDIGEANTTLGLLYGQNFDNNSLFYLAEFPNGENNYSGTGAHRFGPWGSNPVNVTVCTWYPTCSYGGSKNNQAVFEMSGRGVPRSSAVGAAIDGALVYHRENDAPAIQSFGFFQAPQNGWFRQPRLSAQLQLNDAGIGFCDDGNLVNPALASHPVTVTDHNAAQTTNFGWQFQGGCTGSATYAPAPSQINPIWTEGEHPGGNTTTIPDGVRTLRFTARDMFGNASTHTENVKIDRAAPRIELGGRLAAYAVSRGPNGTEPLPAGIRTLTGPSDLTVAVEDSYPNNIPVTSGVAGTTSVRVWRLGDTGNRVSQALEYTLPAPTCAGNDNCDRPAFRIDPAMPGAPPNGSAPTTLSALPSGLYQLEVNAGDRAGNLGSATYVFAIGGGEITSVAEGQGTARWIPLAASRTIGAPTNATFQWRTGERPWQDIPIASESNPHVLAEEDTGARVSSAVVGAPGGKTARYVLDVDALIDQVKLSEPSFSDISNSQISVRASFNGSGGQYDRLSEDVAVRLDRGGRDTSSMREAIGPGEVDALTGNLSLSSPDAVLNSYQSEVSLTRSYGSRYVAKQDGSIVDGTSIGPLGPGWTLSLPTEGEASWTQVVDLNDPARDEFLDYSDPDSDLFNPEVVEEERYAAVLVEAADGSGFVFEQREQDGTWVPQPGYENYKLNPIRTSAGIIAGFSLADSDSGTVTSFSERLDDATKPAYEDTPEHGTYGVTSVDVAGDAGKPTWRYEKLETDSNGTAIPAANRTRVPVRVVGGYDPSLSCSSTGSLAGGCSALELKYVYHAGAARLRLASVSLTATDPDTGNNRTEVVATYEYSPDSVGRLIRATDAKTGLAAQYGYDGDGLLNSITPPGEQAHRITYGSHMADKTKGRVLHISRGAGAQEAKWTLFYADRTLAGFNPWDLSRSEIDKWGQSVTPYRAFAVLPPDVTVPVPLSSDPDFLKKATISYLDSLGRELNHAEPGGRISAIEYDKWGNVIRELTPANRKKALDTTSESTQTAANRYATITTYADDGTGKRRPVREVGPQRDVTVGTATPVPGRSVTLTAYDEGIPTTDPKMPYNLPTTVTRGAVTGMDSVGGGGTLSDARITETQYDLGTRAPKLVIENPTAVGTERRVTRVVLDSLGREVERRQPSRPGTESATATASATDKPTTTLTSYYRASGTASASTCDGRPEWAGLVCEVKPAGTTSSGLRNLPTSRFEYDFWRNRRKVIETAITAAGATETRTTATLSDGAGRPLEETVARTPDSMGDAVDKVRRVYSSTSGQEVETQQIAADGTVRKVLRTYDDLGRLTSYQDAAGNKQVTTYDFLSRITKIQQFDSSNQTTPIATQDFGYDPVTGYATSLKDSSLDSATPMTAEYDLDGRAVAVNYPSGIRKEVAYDEEGLTRHVLYRKTSCTTNCVWYQNTVTRSGHNQIVSDSSQLVDRRYTYDKLGRLTMVNDTASGTCTTRSYVYDANSNRLRRRTASAASPACPQFDTGGSLVSYAYDESDRLTSVDGYGLGAASPTYDAWGRIKNLPKQGSGGGLPVESTYFASDLASTIKNGSVTLTNTLDPLDRVRTRTLQTSGQSTVPIDTYAYGDDGDQPMFTRGTTAAAPNTLTGWTRYVEDPTGEFSAQVTSAGAKALLVKNLRGDTVAEIAASSSATGLGTKFAVDEFGVATGTQMGQRKYGFHGTSQRESLHYGHIVAMGIRSYSPHLGRFLQPDPVLGGNANTYDYVDQDPINDQDLDGRCGGNKRCGGMRPRPGQGMRKHRRRSIETRAQLRQEAKDAARRGQSSFRSQLLRRWRMTKKEGQDYRAHHMLPVQFAYDFKRVGINVNDQRFATLIHKDKHSRIHAQGYNASWERFFERHRTDATYELVLKHAQNLAKHYGIYWK